MALARSGDRDAVAIVHEAGVNTHPVTLMKVLPAYRLDAAAVPSRTEGHA